MDPKNEFAKYILDPDELLEKKKELLRLGATRDQIARALKSAILKPQQREQFKKALPLYEAKIRDKPPPCLSPCESPFRWL